MTNGHWFNGFNKTSIPYTSLYPLETMKHHKVLASSSNPSFSGKTTPTGWGLLYLFPAVLPHEPAMCSAFFRWGCTFVYQSGSCGPGTPKKESSPCHHHTSSMNGILNFQWHHDYAIKMDLNFQWRYHYAIIIVGEFGHLLTKSQALFALRRSSVEAPFTDFVADEVPVLRDAHVLSGIQVWCIYRSTESMRCVCVCACLIIMHSDFKIACECLWYCIGTYIYIGIKYKDCYINLHISARTY